MRSLSAVVCCAAVALVGCDANPPRPTATFDDAGAKAGTATAILNAGVMAEIGPSGDGSAKFLFDPLYDDHFGSLEQLTPELIEAIVTGAPPYDAIDAVFVSHAHGDHFSATMLTRMLAEQPGLTLVTPEQGAMRLREADDWDAAFEDRLITVTLDNGEAGEAFEIAGASVEAFRTPHNGWPESHANVHNITYRVSTASPVGTATVMHLGDADPAAEHYAALDSFFAARRTGLAMVPYWFYQSEELENLITETLNAQRPVAMHVPVAVPRYLEEGTLPYFSDVGDMLVIPATD